MPISVKSENNRPYLLLEVPPYFSDTSLLHSEPLMQNRSKEVMRQHVRVPARQDHSLPPRGYPFPSQDFPGWQKGKQLLPSGSSHQDHHRSFGKVSGSQGFGGDAQRKGYGLGSHWAAPETEVRAAQDILGEHLHPQSALALSLPILPSIAPSAQEAHPCPSKSLL